MANQCSIDGENWVACYCGALSGSHRYARFNPRAGYKERDHMEKPKVEVGQRWKMSDGRIFAVAQYDPGNLAFPWRVYDETNNRQDGLMVDFPKTCAFLGYAPGYGPQPPPVQSVGEVMGELPDGTPAACIGCGKQWNRINSSFVCDNCCGKLTRPDGTCKCGQMITAWEAGARNFPRPPTPTETPAPGELVLENCTVGVDHEPLCRFRRGGSCNCFKGAATEKTGCGRKGMVFFSGAWEACPGCSECPGTFSNLLSDPKPLTAATVEQMAGKAAAGAWLRPACEAIGYNTKASVGDKTCLQLIQEKKAAEPWRPSVDEWDLLPDAGR